MQGLELKEEISRAGLDSNIWHSCRGIQGLKAHTPSQWGVAEQNGRRQMRDVCESQANHLSYSGSLLLCRDLTAGGKGMGGFPEQRRRLFSSSWAEL